MVRANKYISFQNPKYSIFYLLPKRVKSENIIKNRKIFLEFFEKYFFRYFNIFVGSTHVGIEKKRFFIIFIL